VKNIKSKVKNTTKLLGALAVVFGVFLVVSLASASTTDVLQPAAEIVYNEDLTVNGTGRFNSVYVGKQGVGGVTFFNGTIVNETSSDGRDNPVTFGDSVRIDGEIWRGWSKGTADNMSLKISDTMIPTLGDINDFGSASNKWKDIYYSGMLQGGSANLSGSLEVTGDIIQSKDKFGAVKATAYVNSNGNCIKTNGPYTIICSRTGSGSYSIDFNFDVSDRYFQVTPYGAADATAAGIHHSTDDQKILVQIYVGGSASDLKFMITVY
jgi:hypothetical protein